MISFGELMIPILEISAPTGTFRIRLRTGDMRVGRAADCDIFVRDKLVSARHAAINTSVEGAVRVRDLGSTNGIFVNGVRRAEAPLNVGDSVRLGGTILTYLQEVEDAGGSTTEMSVVEAKSPEDQTGFDPYSITVGADEIAADLASQPGTPGSASNALLVARTRLALLHRLGQGVALDADLDRVLTHIAQVVREGIGPERIAILVSEKEGGPAERRFARDWRRPGDDSNVYVPRLVVATAMHQKKVVLYHDLQADARFRDEPRLRETPIRQAMAAPIVYGGHVRGAIYVDRATAEPPFTSEELYLLGIVANLSAASLQNHELFRRERKALEEVKRTQQELVRAAKLATIGELLSNVANEVNNPIAVVLGHAELASLAPDCPAQVRADVEQIHRAAERVRTIIEQLLGFCRRAGADDQIFSIDKGLRQALEPMTGELAGRGIRLEVDILRGIPPVAGDPAQLQHAVMHLVHGAARALEGRAAGRIIVRGRCDHERARISIEDDGPPIPKEALPRVFDATYAGGVRGRPFGMGLSITHAIVEHHGGTLTATSDGASGARFTLDLPLKRGASVEADQTGAISALPKELLAQGEALRRAAAAGAVAAEASAPPPAPSGKLRVLVCDDEEGVLDFMVRRLTKDGFECIPASSGEQALERLAAGTVVDVIVTDLHLGGLDGIELAERAAAAVPSLAGRVIFVTGDTTGPLYQRLRERQAEVLAKPFALGELSAKVAAMRRR